MGCYQIAYAERRKNPDAYGNILKPWHVYDEAFSINDAKLKYDQFLCNHQDIYDVEIFDIENIKRIEYHMASVE